MFDPVVDMNWKICSTRQMAKPSSCVINNEMHITQHRSFKDEHTSDFLL